MKHQKLELLAPAGSFEALKAAIANGADAVYLGGGRFNARINAGNFSEDELILALDYAHDRGVKVYITLNILLKNEELTDALKFAEFAYRHGADAVIVQDLGLLNLLRTHLPEFEVHASTQMTMTSLKSVEALKKLGVKRAVLARELTLEEIRTIALKSGMDIEIFVHGALCVSYSGQCLMSSFVGGRSGNRGVCAQPCRLPWALSRDGKEFGKDGYLISPRDLMAIDYLPQIKEAGVTSLKLEGRMKSPGYVAIVTSIYRKYLDLLCDKGTGLLSQWKVEDHDRERLLQAFNRGGFTQSYLKGDRDYKKLVYTKHPKHQGIHIGTVTDSRLPYVRVALDKTLLMGDGIEIMDPANGPISTIVTAIVQNGEHVRSADAGNTVAIGDFKITASAGSLVYRTLSKALLEEARNTYERVSGGTVPMDMRFNISVGEAATLEITDDDGNYVMVRSEKPAEKAVNKALSEERITEQLQKLGDTPYRLRAIEIESDKESTMPVSALNAMRREALEQMHRMRIGRYKKEAVSLKLEDLDNHKKRTERSEALKLSAFFYEAPGQLSGLDTLVQRIYLPVMTRDELQKHRENYRGQLFIWTPPILRDGELEQAVDALKEISDLADGFSAGSPGAVQLIKEVFPDKPLFADYSMNLYNDASLALLKKLGIESCMLSPELRLNEVKEMVSPGPKLEALVYGRIPLMTMEHCPSAAETGCSGQCDKCARSRGILKDRKGELFPFVRDAVLKRTRIFNTVPVFMEDIPALSETPLDFLRLSFANEDREDCRAVISYYACKIKGRQTDAESLRRVETIKAQGITKGHWFRGV